MRVTVRAEMWATFCMASRNVFSCMFSTSENTPASYKLFHKWEPSSVFTGGEVSILSGSSSQSWRENRVFIMIKTSQVQTECCSPTPRHYLRLKPKQYNGSWLAGADSPQHDYPLSYMNLFGLVDL